MGRYSGQPFPTESPRWLIIISIPRSVRSSLTCIGQAKIARTLHRAASTISRELHRNHSRHGYWAIAAQKKAEARRQRRPRLGKLQQPAVRRYVQERLRQCWSPDEIAWRSRRDFPTDRHRQLSHQTIYMWMRGQEAAGKKGGRYLRNAGWKRLGREKRGGLPAGTRIAGSPPVVDRRRRYGDWEGDTVVKQGIVRDQLTIHSDRGPAMRSQTVAQLLATLGITKSHSRPHVSDDNPFSESQFKTLKYRPEFPARFASHEHALEFCGGFFHWQNHEHHHWGLGLLPPATVHFSQAERVLAARQAVLSAAHAAHPERFVQHAPRPLPLPHAVWINPPADGPEPRMLQLPRKLISFRSCLKPVDTFRGLSIWPAGFCSRIARPNRRLFAAHRVWYAASNLVGYLFDDYPRALLDLLVMHFSHDLIRHLLKYLYWDHIAAGSWRADFCRFAGLGRSGLHHRDGDAPIRSLFHVFHRIDRYLVDDFFKDCLVGGAFHLAVFGAWACFCGDTARPASGALVARTSTDTRVFSALAVAGAETGPITDSHADHCQCRDNCQHSCQADHPSSPFGCSPIRLAGNGEA